MLLLASTGLLGWQMLKSNSSEVLVTEFRTEGYRLFIILLAFSFSYLLRFCCDYWVVPFFVSLEKLKPCFLDGDYATLCVSSDFLYLYLYLSVLYDSLPLVSIMILHHIAFRNSSWTPEDSTVRDSLDSSRLAAQENLVATIILEGSS